VEGREASQGNEEGPLLRGLRKEGLRRRLRLRVERASRPVIPYGGTPLELAAGTAALLSPPSLNALPWKMKVALDLV